MVFEEMNAHEIKQKITSKELTAEDVCTQALERVKKIDPKIQSFINVDEQGALQAARTVDQKIARGESVGLLAGVPVALKDNMCTKDFETTCASSILKGWKPPYDATVVERLKNAGAVILGKVNMDEFAMGSSCENSAFFPTKNPWNPNHVTGGSSGGSAAAVAAGLAPLSIGSDTGGSIRQPASFCGVVGLKPTYGRVSRYGLVAFASSLDQIGPFAHSVEDVALLLEVIAGYDIKDSTSADITVGNYTKEINSDLSNLKIGLPKEYFSEGIQEDVRQAVEEAKNILQDAGATFVDVSLPHTDYCLAAYYLVATAEASSNLARYDGVQYGLRESSENLVSMYEQTRAKGFGDEVKRRIMLGTYALSAGYYDAYYKKALQVRTLIQQDFSEAFKQCDVILTPTSPTSAFKIGEKTSDPLTMYLSDIYTISLNLAGLPGISVPCGFTADSLPVGMQLIGKAFDESTLFKVAKNYQDVTDWHLKKPSLIVDR